MAYRRPEDLGTHGERRVMGIFTMTNVVGLLAGLFVVWNGAGLLGIPATAFDAALVLRVVLTFAGGVAGLLVTIRWTGLSLWDRALLWVMFQLRQQQGKTRLTPPATTSALRGQVRAPLMRDGKWLAEVYDPTGEDFHGAD